MMVLLLDACQLLRRDPRHQQLRKASKVENTDKLGVKTRTSWDIRDLFRSKDKQLRVRCPDRSKVKHRKKGVKYVAKAPVDSTEGFKGANITRHISSIEFDIIELTEQKLDIPSFKQFKNNMTDFTRDGEEEFEQIIAKIRHYLGDNTDGKGVTLHIIGSASQIPTSFDPSEPNNGIHPDGSSVYGKTSIENNRLLAQARAGELARKIKNIFTNITIITPMLGDIKLGNTEWTAETQHRLNEATVRNDREAVKEVYAPFQKDQFVKVISEEKFSRKIQPNAIKMYTIRTSPAMPYKGGEGFEMVNGEFIVSKSTYERIEKDHFFNTTSIRNAFLDELGLSLHYLVKNGEKRWYLLTAEEQHTLEIQHDYKRILEQYEVGLVDDADKRALEKIITEQYLAEEG